MNASADRADLGSLRVVAGAIAAVLLIGALDYITGAEASIAPLYLLPIAIATWFVSLRVGLLVAGLSAVIRLQDLWMTTHHYTHSLTPYWNGVVELGFFVVVAIILSRLRSTTEHWISMNHNTTRDLGMFQWRYLRWVPLIAALPLTWWAPGLTPWG